MSEYEQTVPPFLGGNTGADDGTGTSGQTDGSDGGASSSGDPGGDVVLRYLGPSATFSYGEQVVEKEGETFTVSESEAQRLESFPADQFERVQ